MGGATSDGEAAAGDLLEAALSTLRQCVFVGLMERFEDSMLLLKLTFPVELRKFTSYTTSPHPMPKTELNPAGAAVGGGVGSGPTWARARHSLVNAASPRSRETPFAAFGARGASGEPGASSEASLRSSGLRGLLQAERFQRGAGSGAEVRPEVRPEVLAELRRLNEADLALYAEAVQLFEERFRAATSSGSSGAAGGKAGGGRAAPSGGAFRERFRYVTDVRLVRRKRQLVAKRFDLK